jgi:hypothetical protein
MAVSDHDRQVCVEIPRQIAHIVEQYLTWAAIRPVGVIIFERMNLHTVACHGRVALAENCRYAHAITVYWYRSSGLL